ncbi:MAG: winged helix-turn-helix transcriptional regulator [Planctomycetes bacterium]|nr:winged helix-turn-helix transcriptional regulator [Planctomycetota bacterium]
MLEPRLFKALCEPSRLTILAALAEAGKPLSVGAIAESLPVDLSVVSRHLAILKEAGILKAEKHGKAVHYAVRYERLADTFRAIAGAIESCCPPDADKTQT